MDEPAEIGWSLFEDWLSQSYTSDLKEDNGVNGHRSGDNTKYEKPTTTVLEKRTYTFETNKGWLKDDNDLRAFVTVETPNRQKSFLVVGGVFPDEGSFEGEIDFDVSTQQERILKLMKNTQVKE